MGARPLTDLGLAMLNSLPPKVRNSIDYQAVIHGAAREVALLEASIETVRAQFNPASADVLLNAWEAMLKLPVGGPAGADTATRRNLVLARLRKIVTSGEGQEWEASITAIVGSAGWSYLEHDPHPLQNVAVNPNFDHDAVGATPAGHVVVTGLTTFAVSNLWSDTGAQSLHVVTDPAATVGGGGNWQIFGPATTPLPAGFTGVIAVAEGDILSFRLRLHVNSLAAGGLWHTYASVSYYDAASGFAGGETGAALDIDSSMVGQTLDAIMVGDPIPAGVAYAQINYVLSCEAVGQLNCYVDSIAIMPNPPGGVLPDYHDGDSPGWEWTGTVGDSVSETINPPDGEVRVGLPFPVGSGSWINAVNQIRDITDAHLELVFYTTAAFALDLSDLDVTDFGA